MSYKIIIVISACLALPAALALPAPFTHTETMDLERVMKKSICPIELGTDVNPERIPQVITEIRCAADARASCAKRSIPKDDCCPRIHGENIRSCVEIRNTMYVYFPNSDAPDVAKAYEVSVGCACVHQTSGKAHHLSK